MPGAGRTLCSPGVRGAGGTVRLGGPALSIPSVVGRNGLEEVLEIPLNGEERQALEDSARQMKEAIESLDL